MAEQHSPQYETTLKTEITYLKGVGPHRAKALSEVGVETVRDLLYYFPRRYLDRTTVKQISELRVGDEAVIVNDVARRVNDGFGEGNDGLEIEEVQICGADFEHPVVER